MVSCCPRSGGIVSTSPAIRTPLTANVQEDWAAGLPEETARVFDTLREELRVSNAILSATLDDALRLCQQGGPAPAAQQVLVFAGLFDRLAYQLRVILLALDEHTRHWRTLPNVAPLRPEYFRSERARQVARTNHLLSRLVFRGRALFFHKLGALREVIAGLQRRARQEANRIAPGGPPSAPDYWSRLEILQYDLDTCLQETTVILKSFLCVLPATELAQFRNRLQG